MPTLPDHDTLLGEFLASVERRGVALYPAQEEAVLELFAERNVILTTPTGSGKSLVASALHFLALGRGRRSIYTCPVKALVNEKWLALCREFGPEKVGLATGDATVNRDAPILCCTAEILAHLALREGAAARVDDVVMDEFHYYADRERGWAWQVPLLTLPRTRFLLMSATFGATAFFEEELTRRTGRETVTVSSTERPVPLEFSYAETPLAQTLEELVATGKTPVYVVHFTQAEAAESAQNFMSTNVSSREEKAALAEALAGFKFTSPYEPEMKKWLRHGIGLHHAGLLPKYRVLVEQLAQRGLLKVVCGTDTLGVGVNVPIRTVLFTQLCKYNGEKTAILGARDFHQIAGRAGRKGFDDRGWVVAQAPAHAIENQQLERKQAETGKKFVKRKPSPTPSSSPTTLTAHSSNSPTSPSSTGKPAPWKSTAPSPSPSPPTTFNAFAEKHPWVGQDNIRPKSIAREMFEEFRAFSDYVKIYELERAEGLLLRHLSSVFKVLTQSVPDLAKNDTLRDMEVYLATMLRQVDSSLLDEWERMRDPAYQAPEVAEVKPPGVDPQQFLATVREAIFRVLRALPETEEWREPWEEYLRTHDRLRLDPEARNARHTYITPSEDGRAWKVGQMLLDPGEANDWVAEFRVDLAASREAGEPRLDLVRLGPLV